MAIHVGVAAAYKQRTALLDADPLGTLPAWSVAREQECPVFIPVSASSLAADLKMLEQQGVDLAIIDCPPYLTAESASLVGACDPVVVPVQPTMPDIAGCNHAIEIIKSTKTKFVFFISRAPARAPEVAQAIEALSIHGEVCPVVIGDRKAFSRALASGLSVTDRIRTVVLARKRQLLVSGFCASLGALYGN